MARDNKSRVFGAAHGVGRQRVIARQMRVNDLDIMLANQARQQRRAFEIEGVA
jgi:hypothetical protein